MVELHAGISLLGQLLHTTGTQREVQVRNRGIGTRAYSHRKWGKLGFRE